MNIYKLIEKKRKEQKKRENLKKAKIAGVTVLGASAGAVAGILLAPKSGKEIRNDIVNKTNEVKNDLTTKSSNIKENISEKVSKRKSDISEAKEKISQYLAKKKKTECEEEVIESSEEENTLNDESKNEGEV